ncbi:MAG: MBL fold metallo-hydrolase, partial [Frankiales bacterium]
RDSYEAPPADGLQDVYDFREPGLGTHRIGPFSVTAGQVNHPVECHGLRIEAGGRSLAYSGDTGESEVLVDLARDVDLFLCEASWAHADDNPPGIHLSGRQAGEHAAKAAARLLLLTHVVPWVDELQVLREGSEVFGGPTELARCGVSYDV